MENLIAWVEIPSEDFNRAVAFYKQLLQMELEIIDCDTEKMACFPGGEGAIINAKGYTPSREGVLVSLNTGKKLDATIKRIEELDCEITIPKTKIQAEGRGYFAVFIDCEGNRIGLYGDE